MEVEILRTPGAKLARELSLVLQAVGVPHRVRRAEGGHALLVAAAQAERAIEELARYQRENRAWPPPRPRLEALRGVTWSGVVYAAVLLLAYRVEAAGALGCDWSAIGRVDGARVRAGEWWRCLTALTLHSDVLHVGGNLLFGALFGVLLAQVVGAGPAWLCALLAGALGNATTILLRPEHLSLGASTAVFGALGALAAVQSIQRLRLGHGAVARFLPFLAAALLLGWNGMGSARLDPAQGVVRDPGDLTDVGAHVAGFAWGIALGLALAAWSARGAGLSERARRATGWAVPILLAAAWWLALGRGA